MPDVDVDADKPEKPPGMAAIEGISDVESDLTILDVSGGHKAVPKPA